MNLAALVVTVLIHETQAVLVPAGLRTSRGEIDPLLDVHEGPPIERGAAGDVELVANDPVDLRGTRHR